MGKEKFWYNFRTGDVDYIHPSSYEDYIPQIPAARNMYKILLKRGETPIEAAFRVLEAYAEEKE